MTMVMLTLDGGQAIWVNPAFVQYAQQERGAVHTRIKMADGYSIEVRASVTDVVDALAPSPLSPVPDGEPWNPSTGVVPDGMTGKIVEVQFRDGYGAVSHAERLRWTDIGGDKDVMYWRLHRMPDAHHSHA